MSNYVIPGDTLTDIADSIRRKRDIATEIVPEDMALAVDLIESGGGGAFFTEVTTVPSGRSFSIPTDYDRCIILLNLVPDGAPIAAGCAIGYNRAVKNVAGQTAWLTTADQGMTMICVDNIINKLYQFGYDTALRQGRTTTTERVRSIEPHWLNMSYTVNGGYWTIPIE